MSTVQNNLSGLKAADFQKVVDGKQTDLYILTNKAGYEVAVTNYGGALVAIMVPDRDGNVANVIQGHDNIDDVISSPEPFLSTLIGRYGNRICKGKFTLDGKEYSLAINNGPNALHGGPTGFHARVWDAKQIAENAVELHYVAADMEEGFPGKLDMKVTYTWTDDCDLVIDYIGFTDKKTIVNMTNHGFFALAGIANPTPTIDDLICEINADHYIPIDDTSIEINSKDSSAILKCVSCKFRHFIANGHINKVLCERRGSVYNQVTTNIHISDCCSKELTARIILHICGCTCSLLDLFASTTQSERGISILNHHFSQRCTIVESIIANAIH